MKASCFRLLVALTFAPLTWTATARAEPDEPCRAPFKKVMIVLFENEDGDEISELPFFKAFAKAGALFTRFYAETHPSQPNYIALTSGGLHGVKDDKNHDLDVSHIGDLLEAKGLGWKVYAEGYPGGCFSGKRSGKYVRKHNPMISYDNVRADPERCARIVEAGELDTDVKLGTVPEYSLYVPDLDNDGHDTGGEFADRWFQKRFQPLLDNPEFMEGMLLIATFDEADYWGRNRIYTAFNGAGVEPGSVSRTKVNHYSILRLVEDVFQLGDLGLRDAEAQRITGIWRH